MASIPQRLPAVAEQALSTDPRGAGAHLAVARVSLHRGDPVAALEAAERAVALDPGLADAHVATAEALA